MNNCNTTVKKSYCHLSLEERVDLSLLYSKGNSITSIAKTMGRDKSTISRELRRNQPEIRNVKYHPLHSNERAITRKLAASQKERLKCSTIRNYVEAKLKIGWSPQLIAGRLPLEKPEYSTNHESIYLYIYNEKPELSNELTFGKKHRKKRNPVSKKHASRIPNRNSIEQRPKHIDDREEFGHWETDTAVSRQSKTAIQPIIERKSRYLLLSRIDSKTASCMSDSLIHRLASLPPGAVKTLTYDNGTENAEHEKTNECLGTDSYFCQPYHSWEKGSVENVLGIVRRYLPKKTDFGKIKNRTIKWIEDRINNRPRKCLDYKTPKEVFMQELACCT